MVSDYQVFKRLTIKSSLSRNIPGQRALSLESLVNIYCFEIPEVINIMRPKPVENGVYFPEQSP